MSGRRSPACARSRRGAALAEAWACPADTASWAKARSAGGAGAPGEARGAALWELARLFFRLGATAFGGPAAHVAMMEDEVVAPARLADARGVPRSSRRDEPHPGPQLDRARDPHRAPPRRLGGAARGRGVLHRAGGAHHARVRVGLRPVRTLPPEMRRPLRGEAGDHRGGGPGALGPRPAGCARSARSARRGALRGREPRSASTSSRSWLGAGALAVVAPARGRGALRARLPAAAAVPLAAARRRRRDGRGRERAVRAPAAVPVLPQGRLGPLRERLRAPRVPARGSRRALPTGSPRRSCSTRWRSAR